MRTPHKKELLQPVVITGMGLVCTIGETLESFANALKTGQSGIHPLSSDSQQLPIMAAALLNHFDFDRALDSLEHLPKDLRERAKKAGRLNSIVIKTAIYSALSAWQQANLYRNDLDMERIGLVVSGNNINSRYIYEHYRKYDNNLDYLPASYGLRFFDTHLIGVLSEILQIKGPGFTVGAASASGNIGIIQAAQLIQVNLVDLCLVVGTMADFTQLELQAFYNMGALGPKTLTAEQSCRPFDSKHEGFVYGQGCAALILEKSDHVALRNAKKQAVICGMASGLDANHLSNPSVDGEANVMRKALESAHKNTSDIDYINTHGTSSPLGDQTEINAIKEVFQQHMSHIWLNATKELTGHCLYSSAVIEVIATVLQFQQNFVHPNKNLTQPIDAQARFVGEHVQVANIQCALNNAFGFGGINSSIVLTKSIKGDE